ncbi:MAG: hypothetical protein ABWY29_04190 [Blastococcus sp.]
MPVLTAFATPARLPEPTDADRDAWHARVKELVKEQTPLFPQFFDPTETDPGPDVMAPQIAWNAFPATLLKRATSQRQRWTQADASRQVQDEYCEWSVERDADGVITRVTFTTEVPEYFEHLAAQDPDRLVELYRQLTGRDVALDELVVAGRYRKDNVHNRSTTGRLVHLIQPSNNLRAAIVLAAQATILRRGSDGQPVTAAQELVRCGGLGEPLRNSDPQIAGAVNDAAATGAEISLQDPMGLYIDGLLIGGMATPDGADPAEFWTIERGTAQHAVRASYAVPAGRGYRVGDITADGRKILFGAQLADRVSVRLTALVAPAGHRPRRQPCIG